MALMNRYRKVKIFFLYLLPFFIIGGIETLSKNFSYEENPSVFIHFLNSTPFIKKIEKYYSPKTVLAQKTPQQIYELYQRCPYVEKVEKVKLSYPSCIQIYLRGRVPCAQVKMNGQYFFVDRFSFVLPDPLNFPESNLPIIYGEFSTSMKGENKRIDVSELKGAVGLILFLKRQKVERFFNVVKIYCFRENNNILYTFLTQQRIMVKWGSFSKKKYFGRLSEDEKFNNLINTLNRYRKLLWKVEYIDVRFSTPYIKFRS